MWSAGPLIVRVKHVDTLEEDPGSWVVYITKLHAECRNKKFFSNYEFCRICVREDTWKKIWYRMLKKWKSKIYNLKYIIKDNAYIMIYNENLEYFYNLKHII